MCTKSQHRLYPLQERFSGVENAEPTEADEDTDASSAVDPTVSSEAGAGSVGGSSGNEAAEAEAGSNERPRSTVPVIIRAENAAALGVIVELRDQSAHFAF